MFSCSYQAEGSQIIYQISLEMTPILNRNYVSTTPHGNVCITDSNTWSNEIGLCAKMYAQKTFGIHVSGYRIW